MLERYSILESMGKDTKRKKKDSDFAVTAFRIVQEATKEPETEPVKPQAPEGKNPHAVALGHLGGLKGGKARAEKLSPERRRDIARRAAIKRWKNA